MLKEPLLRQQTAVVIPHYQAQAIERGIKVRLDGQFCARVIVECRLAEDE